MTVVPRHKMTVDEFIEWTRDMPGRFELLHGQVYEMAAERNRHGRTKFRIQTALENAIKTAGAACHMLPDGALVRIPDDGAFEPDALVYCGSELPGDDIEVPNPVIVVEVASPSTRSRDETFKFAGYFRVPSVQHYLMIDPAGLPLVHHARQADGTILSRIVGSGNVRLDPPGIEISVDGLLD
jgi:Uma2 family endonuclease